MKKDLLYMYISFVYINVVGYVFHFVVSRWLQPALYGEFMVLYSFLLAGGNIANSIGSSSVKVYVDRVSEINEIHSYLRKIALLFGFILFVSIVSASPYLNKYLNLSWPFFFVIVGTGWVLMSVNSLEKGFLMARKRFGVVSVANAVELTLRLVRAVGGVYVGLRVGGVLLSSVVAIFIVLMFLVFKNGNIFTKPKPVPLSRLIFLASFTIPPGLFMYADDIFIRRYFPPQVAGYYAASSILGKAFIGFLLVSLSVFFPRIVERRNSPMLKTYLFELVGIYIVCEALALVFILTLGKNFFYILFGPHFVEGYGFMLWYFIATFPLVFHITFINVMLSFGNGIKYIYATLFLYYLGFTVFRFSIDSYFVYIGTFGLLVCIVDYVVLSFYLKRNA